MLGLQTPNLHLASENKTIFQKWAVLLHSWGLARRHFGLLELPALHMKRPKPVQYVHNTMSCLRRSHLKEEAHTVIRRHKFNRSFTIRFPGRITEKAGFSPTLIWCMNMTQGRGLISAMSNTLQYSREKCTLLEPAQQRIQ